MFPVAPCDRCASSAGAELGGFAGFPLSSVLTLSAYAYQRGVPLVLAYDQAAVFAIREGELAAELGTDVERQTDDAVRAAHIAALEAAQAVENGRSPSEAGKAITAAAGPGHGVHPKTGAMGLTRSSKRAVLCRCLGLRGRPERRPSPPEDVFQFAVEDAGSGLQCEVCATLRPAHRLALGEAFGDDLVNPAKPPMSSTGCSTTRPT